MRIAIYPGTFDPITNGHLDVIKRAGKLFDTVIVGITDNPAKTPLFSIEERTRFLKKATKKWKFVEVEHFTGLLARYTHQKKATAIIRGLRELSDFEYEFQAAIVNRRLGKGIETILIVTDEKFFFLNSSLVKEISRLKGNVSDFVPKNVENALKKCFLEEKE
jgi:pantetheine-phosphate adenylyltransferase